VSLERKGKEKNQPEQNRFDGVVVAKLPFQPLYWIRGFTHRGLSSDDFTDCSYTFLYILCSIAIRGNLQKFLGFVPKGAADASMFPMAEPPNGKSW